jgi:CheY-like chemotaxis protein
VLVVDDNETVRVLLEVVLPRHGLEVLVAGGGKEALRIYEQHRDAISLVLLDLHMPEMDGPATLAALRQVNPRVRCCFMSRSADKGPAGDLLSLGASHVLPKPFAALSEVAELLHRIIED